jgi:hypothetical protein
MRDIKAVYQGSIGIQPVHDLVCRDRIYMWKASSKVVDMNVFEQQLTCGIQFLEFRHLRAANRAVAIEEKG